LFAEPTIGFHQFHDYLWLIIGVTVRRASSAESAGFSEAIGFSLWLDFCGSEPTKKLFLA
jgi:hypothetical protein